MTNRVKFALFLVMLAAFLLVIASPLAGSTEILSKIGYGG